MEALQAIFPNANSEALRAVLAVTDGDVSAATNFVISAGLNEVEASLHHASMTGLASGEDAASSSQAGAPGAVHVDATDSLAGSYDENDEPYGEDDDEEEEDDSPSWNASKRPRRVEASAPGALQGQKTSLCQFDDDPVLRKTHIELLNVAPSRTSHKSIVLASPATRCDEAGVRALLADYTRLPVAGWWVLRYPVAEADYVWRILVNAHICSRSLGPIVHVCAKSFAPTSTGEMEVRVLIRDCGDEQHVRRVGAALLSIAPGAHASSHILLHRQQVGKADGAYTLQDRAEFRLQRERGGTAPSNSGDAGASAAGGGGSKSGATTSCGSACSAAQPQATRKRCAVGLLEADRWVHRLYRPQGTGAPLRWVCVEQTVEP